MKRKEYSVFVAVISLISLFAVSCGSTKVTPVHPNGIR